MTNNYICTDFIKQIEKGLKFLNIKIIIYLHKFCIMKKKYFLAGFVVSLSLLTKAQISDLIISEYVHGSGNNRAIELYNGTGKLVDLASYRLERDLNGNGQFVYYYNLSGTLASGETFAIGNPNASVEITSKVIITNLTITDFSGDDQIRLLKNGQEIDRIGVPGGVNFGQSCTYVRKFSVLTPRPGPQDPRFNGEWLKYPLDYYNDLGIFFIPTKKYTFEYDNSGNRIERLCILLSSKKSSKSDSTNTEQKTGEIEPIIDNHGELSILIYPNPTKGQLTLRINGAQENDFFSYTLYSIGGGTLLSGNSVGTDDLSIDMSNCINGIYILVVKSNKMQKSYKVIKE